MAPTPGTNGSSSLQNADLAAEIRTYNATLTKAGEKSRPGKGGGGGRSGPRGAGAAFTAPSPASRMANASNDARVVGRLGNHIVSRESAPLRGARPGHGRHKSHALPASGGNPWAGARLVSNPLPRATGASASPGSMWAAGGAAAQPPANTSSGVTRPSNGAASATRSGTMAPPPVPTSTATRTFDGFQPQRTPSGPEIVTSWSDDPGPRVPGHLRQPSAQAAIREIAELTGMDYDYLTSDGVSIPASRPAVTAAQQPLPVSTKVQSASRIQQDDHSDFWMGDAMVEHFKTEDGMDVAMGESVSTSSIQPTQLANFQEAFWAGEDKPSTTLNAATAAYTPDASTNDPSRIRGTQGLAVSTPATIVAPSANTSQLAASWNATSAAVQNENVKPMGNLQDSIWATPAAGRATQKASHPVSTNAGRSSTVTSVPAPSLVSTQGFFGGRTHGASTNIFGQSSNQAHGPSLSDHDHTTQASLRQISDVYKRNTPPVTTPYTFSQPTNPFGQPSTSIPSRNPFAAAPASAAHSTPVAVAAKPAPKPASKVEKATEYLKDSMWNR